MLNIYKLLITLAAKHHWRCVTCINSRLLCCIRLFVGNKLHSTVLKCQQIRPHSVWIHTNLLRPIFIFTNVWLFFLSWMLLFIGYLVINFLEKRLFHRHLKKTMCTDVVGQCFLIICTQTNGKQTWANSQLEQVANVQFRSALYLMCMQNIWMQNNWLQHIMALN